MKEEQINRSSTQMISRGQIKLNPYNPKNHSDEQVKQQVKNFKRYGYLGGILWNVRSGNLIDGHRRVQALDIIHKYDGAEDYQLKVEVCDLDEKSEIEQMTYMAVGNTKADFNLIAQYATNIDIENIGLSKEEIDSLQALMIKPEEPFTMQELDTQLLSPAPIYTLEGKEKTQEEIEKERESNTPLTVEEVKEIKSAQHYVDEKRDEDRYVLVKFNTEEELSDFYNLLGILQSEDNIVDGSIILEKIC